jgi:hypothetical protein
MPGVTNRISLRAKAFALTLTVLVLGPAAAACGAASQHSAALPSPTMPGMGSMTGDDMPDMVMPSTLGPADASGDGTGLAAAVAGYRLVPADDTVPAGTPSTYAFHISGPDGKTLTRYQPYESKLTVFYLVRSDLTNYQHIDSTMREDGTWDVSLPALEPGSYRAYVTFAAPDAGQGTPLVYVLSRPFTVPGSSANAALPAPTSSATADGYTVSLSGRLKASASVPLSVSVASGGKPVEDFQRFLDGYAHLTAFRVGDMAFARILSTGRVTGDGLAGALTAQALFPESGTWRLFVQFEIGTQFHTAAFTVNVPAS